MIQLPLDLEPQNMLIVTYQQAKLHTQVPWQFQDWPWRLKSEQWPSSWKSPSLSQNNWHTVSFIVVQSLSLVQLFLTPWTVARQASLSFTISWSLLKLMSIELVVPANYLIFCCPPFSSCLQSFPASGSFLMSQLFESGGQSIGASALASVLPMNIQNWFPLGLTGLISLQSKGLSRVFSNTMVQKHSFFGTQPSLLSNSHIHTWLLEKP